MQGFNKVRLAPASSSRLFASADGIALSRFDSHHRRQLLPDQQRLRALLWLG
jgi:hypothetical protein